MRRFVFLFFAVAMFFTANAQLHKVALVSVYGNKKIDASDFGVINSFKSLGNDPAFNLKGIITEVKDSIYSELGPMFPFDFLPEDKIINNEQYKALGESAKKGLSKMMYASPDGYYYIPFTKKYFSQLVDIFKPDSVDGFMVVSVNYSLEKIVQAMGFGTAKVMAQITLSIYDTRGKLMLLLPVTQVSSESIKFALGGNAMDASKILPLCHDATMKAFAKLKEKLPKKIEKMEKKYKK